MRMLSKIGAAIGILGAGVLTPPLANSSPVAKSAPEGRVGAQSEKQGLPIPPAPQVSVKFAARTRLAGGGVDGGTGLRLRGFGPPPAAYWSRRGNNARPTKVRTHKSRR